MSRSVSTAASRWRSTDVVVEVRAVAPDGAGSRVSSGMIIGSGRRWRV
ncbi:hypothetical protein [Quadrisphaera sp. INWT6]|nr:hypothetical protein [Quadrisphaera sp. INWT6]